MIEKMVLDRHDLHSFKTTVRAFKNLVFLRQGNDDQRFSVPVGAHFKQGLSMTEGADVKMMRGWLAGHFFLFWYSIGMSGNSISSCIGLVDRKMRLGFSVWTKR